MKRLICDFIKIQNLKTIAKSAGLNSENVYNRLLNDFKNSYFTGILCKFEDSDDILGYILYYYSYSTWESRVIYISNIFIVPTINEEITKEIIFETMGLKLIRIARDMNCSRINYNINIAEDAEIETLFSSTKVKGINLTKLEEWNFFRMDDEELKKFADIDSEKFEINFLDKNIKIRKINVETDCEKVRKLIYDLAVFEKLEDQFRLKSEDLYNDYKPSKDDCYDKFYDCFVAENASTQEIVSYAIYYYNYSLKNGRGSYLEDLYVSNEWRGHGIGTLMWRKVAQDTLNNNAQYMEWNCLAWNKFAIDFYIKNHAYNTTEKNNLHLIRVRRERIFSDE